MENEARRSYIWSLDHSYMRHFFVPRPIIAICIAKIHADHDPLPLALHLSSYLSCSRPMINTYADPENKEQQPRKQKEDYSKETKESKPDTDRKTIDVPDGT